MKNPFLAPYLVKACDSPSTPFKREVTIVTLSWQCWSLYELLKKNLSKHQTWSTVKLVYAVYFEKKMFRFMVFNATFNNISVISWQSVLLMEEIGVQRKPHTCRKSLTNFIT